MYHFLFTSFWTYDVLTLKGIFHADIESVTVEWLGLSLMPPRTFYTGLNFQRFIPCHDFYSLSFSYGLTFDGAPCCFELWLGLSRVPQEHLLRFSLFLNSIGFTRPLVMFFLALLICVFSFSSIVIVPNFDHIFAACLLKTTSRSIPRACQLPNRNDRNQEPRDVKCHGQHPQLTPWPHAGPTTANR